MTKPPHPLWSHLSCLVFRAQEGKPREWNRSGGETQSGQKFSQKSNPVKMYCRRLRNKSYKLISCRRCATSISCVIDSFIQAQAQGFSLHRTHFPNGWWYKEHCFALGAFYSNLLISFLQDCFCFFPSLKESCDAFFSMVSFFNLGACLISEVWWGNSGSASKF